MSSTKQKSKKMTPLMEQYFKIKGKHPDAVLLFRVGDFYETFGDDAVKVAQAIGIVLTKRNNGGTDIALAGFPYHSLDTYLPRLVKAGFRVAICEQLEKPSPQKKIVKRGVTDVVTPGIAIDDKILDHRSNNFLACLQMGKDHYGIALMDLSTGEFLVSEGNQIHIEKLLQGFSPKEIIFSKSAKQEFENKFGSKFYTYGLDEWIFTEDFAEEQLINHFETLGLKGFSIQDMSLAKIAAGSILHYLASSEKQNLLHVNSIKRIPMDEYMWLDKFTIRNLELIYSPHENGVPLLNILNKTVSPMGSRLLRKWLVLPLKDKDKIEERLKVVEHFHQDEEFLEVIKEKIASIGDIERIIAKVPLLKINPREIAQLAISLKLLEEVKLLLQEQSLEYLRQAGKAIDPCPDLVEAIEKNIKVDPPNNLRKGGVIADGANEELDEYRSIINNTKEILLKVQQTEAERTGIDKLKIGFNNVFGYYLEVTNKYKDKGLVPDNWVRKQTLSNSERYITDELKELETRILGAEEKILALEEKIYQELVLYISDFIQAIQKNANVVAVLDVLHSFAVVSLKQNYCKPELNDGFEIDIKQGRHPVIEQQLPLGEAFVPNDVFLNNDDIQVMMITGPNMAGKSALLRQVALISIMAQMGCFVPASEAKLGIVDKVFTRVGASDNISSGESTFMVEMIETASIMNNISERSLILLDEIGRGTSTYDGISIAWAIAEFLHQNSSAKPKTLFATHYHELNELANKFERIHNYNITTKQVGQKVIFLRKLAKGGSNHSFGIYVAKLAGMPKSIIQRAADILSQLETKSIQAGDEVGQRSSSPDLSQVSTQNLQLSIFETVDPTAGKLKEALLAINVNEMTPIECMMKINELKKLLEEKE